jgi:peptide/nickel transport system substrate-binding protein
VEPDFYYPYFNSSRIPTARDLTGQDRARYRNADVDRWTEEGRHELDPAKRKAIYAKIQRQVATDLPVIPLWFEDNVVLTNVDVHGYTIEPDAQLGGLVTATKSH